jgi:hypothetical protein
MEDPRMGETPLRQSAYVIEQLEPPRTQPRQARSVLILYPYIAGVRSLLSVWCELIRTPGEFFRRVFISRR